MNKPSDKCTVYMVGRRVYQRYCEEMKELSLTIMGLLELSLGLERGSYRDFFEDSRSIMRCNYYPPCPEPERTLGTGPHCDPTALTILLQDDVGGLEVLVDGDWRAVRPVPGAMVINIGDTFMVCILANLLSLSLSLSLFTLMLLC
jgi:gibberellin-44 dioxygenase